MAEPHVISSESEAFAWLARWVEGKPTPPVVFLGWPVLRIDVSGGEYNSSLNASQMAALVEFRLTMGRVYSLLTHGAYDMRRLKREEEDEVDFRTQVSPGSSLTGTDFTSLIQAIANAANAHPNVTLAAAIVLGLIFVSRPIILKHYEARAKQLDQKERQGLIDLALNAQELARYQLFQKGQRKIEQAMPQFAQALPNVRSGFWRFASASLDAESINVAGLTLAHKDLEILSERRLRRRRNIQEVEDIFRIVAVRNDGTKYRVHLESPALSATVVYQRPQLTADRIKRLLAHFVAGQKIRATLELKLVDKSMMGGRLIRFDISPDED